MTNKLRLVTGWSLISIPFILHAVLESTGKGWLLGVPEPLVDSAFITIMFAGFVLVFRNKLSSIAARRVK